MTSGRAPLRGLSLRTFPPLAPPMGTRNQHRGAWTGGGFGSRVCPNTPPAATAHPRTLTQRPNPPEPGPGGQPLRPRLGLKEGERHIRTALHPVPWNGPHGDCHPDAEMRPCSQDGGLAREFAAQTPVAVPQACCAGEALPTGASNHLARSRPPASCPGDLQKQNFPSVMSLPPAQRCPWGSWRPAPPEGGPWQVTGSVQAAS